MIREPRQAGQMSPHMMFTVSHETTFSIGHESFYLGTNLGTRQHSRCRFRHYGTFREVLDVISKRVARREELTM